MQLTNFSQARFLARLVRFSRKKEGNFRMKVGCCVEQFYCSVLIGAIIR